MPPLRRTLFSGPSLFYHRVSVWRQPGGFNPNVWLQCKILHSRDGSGLQFLHGHNIVHRDIKPENIMLDRDGDIHIIELGLAQDGVTSSTKINGVTETLDYMAPELLLEKGL